MKGKRNILFISSIPAKNISGGSVVFFNHLRKHKDFNILEITNKTLETYKFIKKLRNYCKNTRLYYPLEFLILLFIRKLLKVNYSEIRKFKPECVITVAHGDLFWVALKIARKMKIPIITFYHDWWPIFFNQKNEYPTPFYYIHNYRFLKTYKRSSTNICVSEGMQKQLGKHKSSFILPPYTGHREHAIAASNKLNSQFKIVYAGNISNSYGSTLQEIISAKPKDIAFEIIGNPEDWDKKTIKEYKKMGLLSLPLPEETLFARLEEATALLVLSSFDENIRLTMATNFPSKIMLYASIHKPIIIWGPTYSEGVKFIEKTNSGLIVTKNDVQEFWSNIKSIKEDATVLTRYANNAARLSQSVFDPDNLQRQFKEILNNTINQHQHY